MGGVAPRKAVYWVVGVAAAVRLAVWFTIPDGYFASDENSYYSEALRFIDSGVLGTFWPPVTPVLIALLSLAASSEPHVLRLFWIGLSLVNVWLVFGLARRAVHGHPSSVLRAHAPWLAALAYALYLPAISFSQFLTSETPAAFLLLASIYVLSGRSPLRVSAVALSGALVGLLILTRTNLLFVSVAQAAAVFWVHRQEGGRKLAVCFLVASLSPLAGYLGYNVVAHGELVLTSNAPYNLYIGNREHYTEDLNLLAPAATPAQIRDRARGPAKETLSDEEMQSRALRYIAEHPLLFARRALGRLARVIVPKTSQLQMVGGERAVGVFSPVGLALLSVTGAQYAFVLFLGTAGYVSFSRTRRPIHTYCIAATLGALPMCIVAISKPRYSFPFDSLMTLYAAAFVLALPTELDALRKRKLWYVPLAVFYLWSWSAWIIFSFTSRSS